VLSRSGARFAALCAKRNLTLPAHVSSANAARDLDLMRQAGGESKINYYGLSYGTFLGTTYANLFPGKIRSMVSTPS
jgi:pimeloyl-ACP methyl ester carboxylesterase